MIHDREATAVVGGGCFWCLEPLFKELRGVLAVKSGYAGGAAANPTYAQVCTGTTGHAEVVCITYDPAALAYADLLHIFFAAHDPTTRDRQGNDVGAQYRSIVFAANDEQARIAHDVMQEITSIGLYDYPLVTQVVKLSQFWPAEKEHDDYFARNPRSAYCQAVVGPKLTEFRKQFATRLKAEAA
jgi:peptide-methionine (S)-S-oxide reductase